VAVVALATSVLVVRLYLVVRGPATRAKAEDTALTTAIACGGLSFHTNGIGPYPLNGVSRPQTCRNHKYYKPMTAFESPKDLYRISHPRNLVR